MSEPMREGAIYVDIDDVLGHTIEALIDLLEAAHGRRVEVEDVREFHLGTSFSLDPESLEAFMRRAHEGEALHAIEPVRGAVPVLARWQRAGRAVHLVTGRPPATRPASEGWLARHGFPYGRLHFLDKFSRPGWNDEGLPALTLDELPGLDIAFAVEDALSTAVHLVEALDVDVALIDRPWNRDTSELPGAIRRRLVRCRGWSDVARRFPVAVAR